MQRVRSKKITHEEAWCSRVKRPSLPSTTKVRLEPTHALAPRASAETEDVWKTAPECRLQHHVLTVPGNTYKGVRRQDTRMNVTASSEIHENSAYFYFLFYDVEVTISLSVGSRNHLRHSNNITMSLCMALKDTLSTVSPVRCLFTVRRTEAVRRDANASCAFSVMAVWKCTAFSNHHLVVDLPSRITKWPWSKDNSLRCRGTNDWCNERDYERIIV